MTNNYEYNELTQDEMFDIVMNTIRTYGFEALDYILTQWPEFDINHTVEKRLIGMYNFEHSDDVSVIVEDENGNKVRKGSPTRFYKYLFLNEDSQILFSGRLIHYAILKNDLEAVEYLLSKGAHLVEEEDEEDFSNYYANSVEMLQFLNSTESYLRNRR